MKTLTTTMAALVFLLATALGYAQAAKALPSEIDLRAAYCIPYAQYIVSLMDSAYREYEWLPAEPLEEVRAVLRRLQLYLLPRLPHLEMLGVLTAQTRAKEDIASLKAYAERCRAKCNLQDKLYSERKPSQQSCFEKCQGTHPANAQMKACSDLGWLPY